MTVDNVSVFSPGLEYHKQLTIKTNSQFEYGYPKQGSASSTKSAVLPAKYNAIPTPHYGSFPSVLY
jgi:hypothetical protein